ncbi:MAG TPA: AAA family ATPase [archaeon]|nr:AAA family ATPase [archaeon]
MRICITGTPGVGKTTIAKKLGQELGHKVLNEKEFSLREGIGEFDAAENELVVPIEKLESRLNKLLAKEKNIIVEGHMLCEIKGKFDFCVLLRLNPERLGARLELRGYRDEKVQDNVFCEGIDYCKKHAARNYAKAKIIELENRKTIKETTDSIITELFLRAKPLKELSRKTKRKK